MLILYRENFLEFTNELILLTREEIQHIKALRLKNNDELFLSNGKGVAYKGLFQYPDKIKILYNTKLIENKIHNVSIFSAIPSGNRFEKMLDIAVQLGLIAFYPVIFEFSERKDFNLNRVKKIIQQASSQSGRYTLAEIHPPIKFQEIIKIKQNYQLMIYADRDPKNKIDYFELINTIKKIDLKEIAIIIGPEGGFSKKEKILLEKNFKGIVLNENILRIETAVINVLSVFSFLKLNNSG
jgi:16S rRNA (uracil1498-N3)-methyltransferase